MIGNHFSDIDEDEQEDEATSQSLDMGIDGEAQPLSNGASVTHGCGVTEAVPDGADFDPISLDSAFLRATLPNFLFCLRVSLGVPGFLWVFPGFSRCSRVSLGLLGFL